MKIKQPAMTSVFPAYGSLTEKIKFLKQQVSELEQQKKCYNKMILDRRKMIRELQKKETMVHVFGGITGYNKKRPKRRR